MYLLRSHPLSLERAALRAASASSPSDFVPIEMDFQSLQDRFRVLQEQYVSTATHREATN